jgi:selenocysteine lyase/cysteine desulfurase
MDGMEIVRAADLFEIHLHRLANSAQTTCLASASATACPQSSPPHSANVFVSVRGDSVRVSPHLYKTSADIDRLFAALASAM